MYTYTIDVVRMKEKKATGNRRQAVRQRIEENKWSYFPFFLYTMPHTMAVTNPLLFIIAYMFILFVLCCSLHLVLSFTFSHRLICLLQWFRISFCSSSFILFFCFDSTRLDSLCFDFSLYIALFFRPLIQTESHTEKSCVVDFTARAVCVWNVETISSVFDFCAIAQKHSYTPFACEIFSWAISFA